MRFAVDGVPDSLDRALLILFFDAQVLDLTLTDSSGAEVTKIPIAGSGIFGAESCMSARAGMFSTWLRVDRALTDRLIGDPTSFRVVVGSAGGRALRPSDTGCRGEPRRISEAAAWAQVRAALPSGVPVAVPAWLPATIDRSRVVVSRVTSDPANPGYEVIYPGPRGGITLGLGRDMPQIDGSGYGTRVRGVPATLTFSTSLWNDPTSPAPRRVRWVEGAHTLWIDSSVYSGDDLLHVAWSLDPAGAPPPKHPVTRTAVGSCARAGGTAEETVRTLISLIGRGPGDAIADCFADDYLGEFPGVGVMWAGLPGASPDSTRPLVPVGGRASIAASWTFASDPGGAWNRRQSMFFLVGLRDGRWRIHEGGTAAIAPPP